jgi:hypothetical protein
MPDLDAIDDLTRLPAAGPGGLTATVVNARAGVVQPTTAPGPQARAAGALMKYLDIAVVLLAGIPLLAGGVPALGYAIAAGAWVAQRVLAQLDRRWIEQRSQLGLSLFEAFGRIWLLAGAIVLAGVVGGRADGLTAALVIFVAYSIAFWARLISGRPQGRATA